MTDDEIEALAAQLAGLETGELPLPIFHQIARLVVLSTIELVPLRLTDTGEPLVLMFRREEDDPVWPNLWHTPGRILRSGEIDESRTYATVINRLVESEMPGVLHGEAVLVGNDFRLVKRGGESAALHWMEIHDEEPAVGKFFPVAALPDDIVDHHPRMIRTAVEHFVRVKA